MVTKRTIIYFIPLVLFWLIAFFLLLSKFGSLSVISQSEGVQIDTFGNDEMRKGDISKGWLVAKNNYLGIVAIRFESKNKMGLDSLVFRIKERGRGSNWYYENVYLVGQIQNNDAFTFGFPPIKDSENKTYDFEVEILSDDANIGLSLGKLQPIVTARYQYPKSLILSNSTLTVNYLHRKLSSLYKDKDVLGLVFSGLVSILLCLSILSNQKNRYPLIAITVFLTITLDSFFGFLNQKYLFISFFYLWFLFSLKSDISSTITGLFSVIFLLLIPFSITLNLPMVSESFADWTLVFLIITAILWIIENHKRKTPEIDFRILISDTKTLISDIKRQTFYSKIISLLITSLFWLLSLYLFLNICKKTLSYYVFYYNFFDYNQLGLFIKRTGLVLSFIYILALILICIVIRTSQKLRTYLVIVILLVAQVCSDIIFTRTTSSFRNKVYVWTINPKSATLWDEIIINGVNFKDVPFQGRVVVGSIEHRVLKWSNNKIVIQADPTITKAGKMKVITADGKESNEVDLEYR